MESFKHLIDEIAQALVASQVPEYLVPVLVSLASFCFFLLIKKLLLSRLIRASEKTHFFADTLVLTSLKAPLTVVLLSFHLVMAERLYALFEIGGAVLESTLEITAKILLVVAIILFIDRTSTRTISHFASRSALLRNSQGIARGLTRGLVFGLGVLVLLGTMGISVTPVLASLGVTSLAVALALQPTLENFFSGVQLLIDKPFRVGDYIELDSGEQGWVEKIGWRSTWVKLLANNVVIIPNTQVSSSRITNYDYPVGELSVLVECGVHYDSDLKHVQQITLEVARNILSQVEGAQPEFDPLCNFHTFADSSINFTVVLRAKQYVNNFVLKSEFIKALHARYAQENITIPYPIRAINLSQEGAVESLREAGLQLRKQDKDLQA